MSDYTDYVIAAYAVFFVVLGWDFVATRLQIRRELRNVRLRAARAVARTPSDANPTNELSP
ncbi:MAG: heme exporter protein CcmD [Lysobacter sp.]